MPPKRKPPVIGVERTKRARKPRPATDDPGEKLTELLEQAGAQVVTCGDKLIPDPCEDPLQDLIEDEEDMPRSKKCDS